MPYIKKEDRKLYDGLVEKLGEIVSTRDDSLQDGDLNYIITSLIKKVYPLKYKDINRAMGMLECVKQEYYRRVAAPYEDSKIEENGDV